MNGSFGVGREILHISSSSTSDSRGWTQIAVSSLRPMGSVFKVVKLRSFSGRWGGGLNDGDDMDVVGKNHVLDEVSFSSPTVDVDY